ncbi:S-layer homology domain-containing protein [Paenibacillus sp. NPDC058071]|uniref:S-layer homology domain-containing protein n=1 Tax=Paenibacillus sp. NPDC058071 TaxID=3346326 RepID=UPI0036DF79D3
MLLQKAWKKSIALGLTLLMLVSLFSPTAAMAAGGQSGANAVKGYVTVAVEKFTLGQGYVVEPVRVPIHEGDNAAAVISELLGEDNYDHSGTVDSGFYLSSVYDPGAGEAKFPAYILQALGGAANVDDRADEDWLGEFDYYYQSGWNFAVNHSFPSVGASDVDLNNGDVVRWQYTVYGYGEDIGNGGTLISPANKDALTEKVAEINSSADKATILADAEVRAAYENAYHTLTNMESGQSAVDAALSDLTEALGETAQLNTAELAAAIQLAELAKTSVKVSVDGSDVSTTEYWVVQAELDAFVQLIVSAQQLIADSTATQDGIDAKVLALEQAQAAFNQAIKQGLQEVETKYSITFTVAPKAASLELYNAKNQLVDIGTGQSGTYKVYQASLPAGDYRYKGLDASGNSIGGGKLTITTQPSQAFEFRQLNFKASNAGWNVDTDYTVKVGQNSPSDTSLIWGTKTAAGEYPVLVLTGNTYFYSFEPTRARDLEGYNTASSSVTVTLAATAQNISTAIPLARAITFTVPEEAKLIIGRKLKHFIAFEKTEPVETTIQGGKKVYRYKLSNNVEYNYRVNQDGKLTNVGTFIANAANAAMEITEAQLNLVSPHSILNRGTSTEGNIYLNLNEQNHLKLAAPGSEFKLLSMRSWQTITSITGNYFFEPDFHYEIVTGQNIIDIAEGEPGGYATIRAKANGTAVVKVSYDAIKVNSSNGNEPYSAIWPENVGLFVVTVGQGETGIATGIESNKVRNQKANQDQQGKKIMNLQNGAFDADIDSVYFLNTEQGATYTFTPSAGSTVSVLRPEINHAAGTASYGDGTFSSNNVTANPNGSFSVFLTEGRNIVKVEKAGLAEYQVMTARPLTVTIQNLTRQGEEAGPGDRVKVTLDGLSFPANKLSGIYNFAAQLNFPGPNETWITGLSRQYNITTQANSVEFQVPADLKGGYSLKGGHIKVSGFGSPVGDHHNIDPLVGANPNFTADSREGYYSILPRIVIVKEADKTALQLAVDNGKEQLKSVSVSTDGEDVYQSQQWVAKGVYDQYVELIESAQSLIADESATQGEVDAKVRALEQEHESFVNAKKPGLKKDEINVTEQLNKHLSYIFNHVTEPAFGTMGGEWSILALARAGYEVPQGYYATYYNNVVGAVKKSMSKGKLHSAKSTEHSRLILGLTSIGKDISNVAGYDISAALADFNYVTKQGINGPIFALIALDSHAYEIPVQNGVAKPVTRDALIDYIVSHELAGGGWSLNDEADPDMTGMALQALAPYYEEKKEVKAAVDRALHWLSTAQNEAGGYASGGKEKENVQSAAQVIVALTALGIDPHTDKRFNKKGHSVVENLLTYAVPTGGFVHPKGGSVNEMATDQGTYALVAYSRYLNGETSLYDMSDVVIKATEPNGTIELPADSQPIAVPNDGQDYTIKVKGSDRDKQVSVQLPDSAASRTFISLPGNAPLPQLTISRGSITAEFPQGIAVDNDSIQTLELITPNNKNDAALKSKLAGVIASTQQLNDVHEFFTIGDDHSIQFLNGFVTFTFNGMKGKEAAFIQNGRLTPIQKFASEQEGRASGKHEYAFEHGNDLLVKTDHFTEYVVYSVKDKTETGGGTQPGGGNGPKPEISTIQLSIDKLTINKGYVISPTTVEFTPGETVWDVLRRELDKRGIDYEYSFSDKYNSVYVESIAGDGEFVHGSGSGWMYSVNNGYPSYGASRYTLQQGDNVKWRYTTNLGKDVGGGAIGGEEDPAAGGKDPEDGASKPGTEKPENEHKTLADFYTDSAKVSSWATDLVLEATKKQFIQGFNGKLNPKNKITRAEFAKLLVEVFNVQADGKTASFRDVRTTDWFYPYINAAYAAEVVKGNGDRFLPNDTITREEMAVMIARVLKREPAQQSGVVYQDRNQISVWAQDYIADIAALNIMTGNGDQFNPKETATREMAFVVAMRAYQYSENQQVK